MIHSARMLILLCAFGAPACSAEPHVNVGKARSQVDVAGSSGGGAGAAGDDDDAEDDHDDIEEEKNDRMGS